jgi:hypothetical protein
MGCTQLDRLDKMMNQQEEEIQNVSHVFEALEQSIQKIMHSPKFPINEEYCWMHDEQDGEHMGGWKCQHPLCTATERDKQHRIDLSVSNPNSWAWEWEKRSLLDWRREEES